MWSTDKGSRVTPANTVALQPAITAEQYKEFIARMVVETTNNPVMANVEAPLQEVLEDFRLNPLNPYYRGILDITYALMEMQTVPERPVSIRLAEQAYALAIISLASASQADKIKGQRDLKDTQRQLALMYADNDIFIRERSGQHFSPADREAKEKTYQTLLDDGTLSAYLVNMLKNKGLVPETTKLGGLGL